MGLGAGGTGYPRDGPGVDPGPSWARSGAFPCLGSREPVLSKTL